MLAEMPYYESVTENTRLQEEWEELVKRIEFPASQRGRSSATVWSSSNVAKDTKGENCG